jgi:hypothetical protein
LRWGFVSLSPGLALNQGPSKLQFPNS